MQGAARMDEEAARLRSSNGSCGTQAGRVSPGPSGPASASAPPPAAYNPRAAGGRAPSRSPAHATLGPPPPAPDPGGGAGANSRRAGAWWARDADGGGVSDADALGAAAAAGVCP